MTDRGLPIVDGAPACPFVAYANDRDARSTSPDHRHRCYAEVRPAERALAHQEAYCLSSAFPVCPTFQDWARREAAAARPGADRDGQPADPERPGPPSDPEHPPRAPHRDWSAPPHWAVEPAPRGGLWEEPADDEGDEGHEAFDDAFDNGAPGRDPARSAADRAHASRDREDRHLAGDADERVGYDGDRSAYGRDDDGDDDDGDDDDGDDDDGDDPARALYGDEDPMERSARRRAERAERLGRHRAAIASVGAGARLAPGRGQARPAAPHDDDAPSWERPRRYEAYPTIRTRMGMPGVPRLGLVAVAIVIAGVALFFLPALLGVGGPDGGTATSPSPSSAGSPSAPPASLEPTPTPAPTPVIYVVKAGDTLSKIASQFGVTLQDILDANRDTISDPNKIKVGDRIVIPTAPPTEFVDPSASGSLPPP